MGKLSTGQATGTAFWTGGGAASTPLTVEQDGTVVDANTTTENFTGSGVSVVDTTAGTVQIDVPGFQGLFRSPDGSCFKVTIANDGTPTYTKVPCPGSAAPSIVGGGMYFVTNNHKSGFNPIDSIGSPCAVTAGELLVAVACFWVSVNSAPNATLTDTAGNVWTEHAGPWVGSDPDGSFFKMSYFTAIANASTTTTPHMAQDGTAFSACVWGLMEITDFNAAGPFGVEGNGHFVGHSAVSGETFDMFTSTTTGTPAPNSLILAAACNWYINGFTPAPDVYDDDPAFTSIATQDTQNPWGDQGFRFSTNPGGAASSLWTAIPSAPNGVGTLELAVGHLLEIRAA